MIVSCVFAELKQENGIYVLNDSNFQKTVKENESMFIEFYSSVCVVVDCCDSRNNLIPFVLFPH